MTSFMTYQHFYDLLTYFGYLQLDGYFQINALVKKKWEKDMHLYLSML